MSTQGEHPPPMVVNMDDTTQKRGLLEHIQQLTGLYDVVLKRRRRPRTLNQNSYYWAAFCTPFLTYMHREWGDDPLEPLTLEDAHNSLKLAVLGPKMLKNAAGEEVMIMPSTAFMTVEEFTAYLDKAAIWLESWCSITVLSSDMFRETEKG